MHSLDYYTFQLFNIQVSLEEKKNYTLYTLYTSRPLYISSISYCWLTVDLHTHNLINKSILLLDLCFEHILLTKSHKTVGKQHICQAVIF